LKLGVIIAVSASTDAGPVAKTVLVGAREVV
jgi:hypothetical protein